MSRLVLYWFVAAVVSAAIATALDAVLRRRHLRRLSPPVVLFALPRARVVTARRPRRR